MKKIRNMIHVIGGFMLMYKLAHIGGMFEYEGIANAICIVIVLTVFSTCIGMIFEYLMKLTDDENVPSIKDVFRTGFGGVLAGIAVLFPFSKTLFLITLFITLIALLFESFRIINISVNNKRINFYKIK